MERTVTVQTRFSTGARVVPPLTKATFDYHNFPADLLNEYSSLVRSEHKFTCPSTGFVINVPPCSRDHLFVVYPIVEKDDGSHQQMVYAIRLGRDEILTRADILNRLKDAFSLEAGDDVERLVAEETPGDQSGGTYTYGSGTVLCYCSRDDDHSSMESSGPSPSLFPSTRAHHNDSNKNRFNPSPPSVEASPPSQTGYVSGTERRGATAGIQANEEHQDITCRKAGVALLPHLLHQQQPDLPKSVKHGQGFNPAHDGKTNKHHKIAESPSVPYERRLITADEKTIATEDARIDIQHPSDGAPVIPGVQVTSPEEESPVSLPSTSPPSSLADKQPSSSKQQMCVPDLLPLGTGMVIGSNNQRLITRSSSMTLGDRKRNLSELAGALHQRSSSDTRLNQPTDILRQVHTDVKRLTLTSQPPAQESSSSSVSPPKPAVAEFLKVDVRPPTRRASIGSFPPVPPYQRQFSSKGEQVMSGQEMRSVGDRFKSGLLSSPTKDSAPSEIGSTRRQYSSEAMSSEDNMGSGSDCTQDMEPEISEVDRHQIHLMEHAVNNRCLKTSCSTHFDPESIRQMKMMITRVREGTSPLSAEVKRYIITHCSWCSYGPCHIPHMAVGCKPPVPLPPALATQLNQATPSAAPRHNFVGGSTSFDVVAANQSTTTDLRQSTQPFDPQGPAACTDAPPMAPPLVPRQQPRAEQTDLGNPVVIAPQAGRTIQPGVVDSPTFARARFPRTACRDGGGGVYHQEGFPQAATPEDDCQQLEGVNVRPQQPSDEETREKVWAYPQHNRGNSVLRLQAYPNQNGLPDVATHGFPILKSYANQQPGTVIHCSDGARRVLIQGSVLPIPAIQSSAELGKGGNGTVFRHFFRKLEFAIKKTSYRTQELNIWRTLDHPSIVPLSGVMLSDDGKCFQLMPCMQNNLSRLMRECGPLVELARVQDRATYHGIVLPNLLCIIRKALLGIDYLHSHQLQHYDLKASNILVSSKCTSQHQHKFPLCDCLSLEERYEVRIADFDSIKRVPDSSHHPSALPDGVSELKSDALQRKVMGTPGYRAPEQFQQMKASPVVRRQCDGSLEGTWCDMFSFGNILLTLCLGSNTDGDRQSAWCLHGEQAETKFSKDANIHVECTHALVKLNRLFSSAGDDAVLYELAKMAAACLEANFRKRATAKELLCRNVFTSLPLKH